jgi:hypothetical protein
VDLFRIIIAKSSIARSSIPIYSDFAACRRPGSIRLPS